MLPRETIDLICERYLAGESSPSLGRAFGTSEVTIRNHLERRGVARRPCWAHNVRYRCNEAFFRSVETESHAYWLGFVAADGCINKDRSLVLTLASIDREHLCRFRDALAASHPVRDYLYGGRYPGATLRIISPAMIEDLGRFGVTPRKTHTFRWPDLPTDLRPHFLRGYVDGDGGFYDYPVKGRRYRQHIFALTANRPFVEAAQEFLMNSCDLRRTRLRYYRNPEVATLTYGGRGQVSRIAAVLYQDATIYLPRKRIASLT